MEADKPATDSMFFACAMIFLVATAVASGWGTRLVWGGLCAVYAVGGLIARQRARRQEERAQAQAEAALAAAAALASAAPLGAGPAPALSIVRAGAPRPVAAHVARRAPAIAG